MRSAFAPSPAAMPRGHSPRRCSHDDPAAPCDAALLATEAARLRARPDFASDLLDAHLSGFSASDWQGAEGLAHALEGSDWPPDWKRDLDDPARIIVDPSVWPTHGLRDLESENDNAVSSSEMLPWRRSRRASEPNDWANAVAGTVQDYGRSRLGQARPR